jgi:hypothetical protein
VRKQTVDMHAANLVEMSSGCDSMFKGKKLNELALMFRVFKRNENENFKYMIEKMAPYIEIRGKVVIEDVENLKDPILFT